MTYAYSTHVYTQVCTIYNTSVHVVSGIQTWAEDERLYIRYNTDEDIYNIIYIYIYI